MAYEITDVTFSPNPVNASGSCLCTVKASQPTWLGIAPSLKINNGSWDTPYYMSSAKGGGFGIYPTEFEFVLEYARVQDMIDAGAQASFTYQMYVAGNRSNAEYIIINLSFNATYMWNANIIIAGHQLATSLAADIKYKVEYTSSTTIVLSKWQDGAYVAVETLTVSASTVAYGNKTIAVGLGSATPYPIVLKSMTLGGVSVTWDESALYYTGSDGTKKTVSQSGSSYGTYQRLTMSD
jgi:hypothetical protein